MSTRTSLIGLAGEYAVASELCKRGWLALLPPAGHRDWDIIATRETLVRRIQVKTTECGTTWMLSQKAETSVNHVLYVFASLEEMRYWIVPGAIVAEQVHQGHVAWLEGRTGRSDGTMRKWRANAEWESRWDLLEIENTNS